MTVLTSSRIFAASTSGSSLTLTQASIITSSMKMLNICSLELPLVVLIYRSKFIPKVFGILFEIEVVFALLSVVVHFLIPNESLESALLLPGVPAEFAFMFWLLIRGINESKLPAQTVWGLSENILLNHRKMPSAFTGRRLFLKNIRSTAEVLFRAIQFCAQKVATRMRTRLIMTLSPVIRRIRHGLTGQNERCAGLH